MKILVNGEQKIIKDSLSLKHLIELCNLKSERIAVEINGKIIERENFLQTTIKEKDKIEFIEFLGGG